MLWLKAFHIIFMVTWFAGLFYLPRIFVYHAMAEDETTRETFKVMERKLLIMTHLGGALTWIFGLALILTWPRVYLSMGWLHAKLALVLVLVAYHVWCWRLVRVFARDGNRRDHVWYRWFNEVPVLFLIAIVLLAILKPF
ncbi:MAG: CopD family protein [Xanthomonadales bacterium]|jgi:putative membrane protein|nr:CopD family protein [Xanthomonadales bacterium]